MFDDPGSLRDTARRYRRVASQTTDRDVVHVFTAVAEQYDQKAAALEIERVKGISLRAWDSILRRQRIIQPADRLAGLGTDKQELR